MFVFCFKIRSPVDQVDHELALKPRIILPIPPKWDDRYVANTVGEKLG